VCGPAIDGARQYFFRRVESLPNAHSDKTHDIKRRSI